VGPPSVLAIVLNYNAGPPLGDCLRSLRQTTYPDARLVVIDNGSSDGSLEAAKRIGVDVVPFGENLGYCAAYNRAFRELAQGADFVLLSNPDLIVPPPTIERLVAAAGEDEAIGFVGPVQRHADTRDIRSAGIRWRCGRLPEHVLRLGEPIDALEGAFLLVRRRVIERVGGLDEAFALNLEDVEWQRRAARAGFRSALAPEADILHLRPGATRVATGAYYQTRNACLLTSRYCTRGSLRRLQLKLCAEGVGGAILGRPRGRFILQGLRDFRRGVTGMRSFR